MAIDVERLKEAEMQFGGMFRDVRYKNSPMDKEPGRGDRGCDRMVYQNYAPLYAEVLPENPKRIVEMGIFKGTGLAMWSVLYPDADIIGLDVDTERYRNYLPTLKGQGAFKETQPLVMEFDEFNKDDWREMEMIIRPESVDVWIDDAVHRTDVIMDAYNFARRFMAPGSVYIIEDNEWVPDLMRQKYEGVDGFEVVADGRLTAILKA